MRVVGLTGGICSGKSTVASMLREMGVPVLDADEVTHKSYMPGTEPHRRLVEHFGDSILKRDGTIDRKKLGEIVFSDPTSRALLEEITHPFIEREMIRFVEKCRKDGNPLCVIEAALIFEKGKGNLFERIITVFVDEKTQIKRLMERDGVPQEEALSRVESQMPLREKARLSDYVIDNSGSLEDTRKQVERLIVELFP